MFFALIKLALRNVLRNRRRSGLTLASVVIGLTALFFQQSLIKSLQSEMANRAINVFNSHLQIQAQGSQDLKMPEISFRIPDSLETEIRRDLRVEAVSKRVLFTGLVASASSSLGTGILGVDPDDEKQISSIAGYLREGKFLNSRKQIFIGSIVARNLDVRVGEKVVLMAQNREGSLEGTALRVAGIFDSGSYTWDASIVYMHREDAQEILGWENRINAMAIRLKPGEPLEEVQKDLARKIQGQKSPLKVLTWKDIGSEIIHIQGFQDAVLFMVLMVVFAIVALGILNTMLMSLFERIREFGLMMALGAKRWHVALLLLAESTWLGLTGLVWGAGWGAAIIIFFHFVGLPLPLGKALSYFLPFEKTLHLQFAWGSHLLAVLCVIGVSVVAGLIPAFRVARLKAAEALRHV